jgi:MFS family permease
MAVKPLAGRLSDRIGRKPVIVGGLLFCTVALPLIFRAQSFAVFSFVSAVLGIGVGAVTPVTNALIADLASTKRLGAAMGVFGTVFDFGEAMGPIVAGFLIGALGYASTFDVLAAVTLAATAALFFLVTEPRRVDATPR